MIPPRCYKKTRLRNQKDYLNKEKLRTHTFPKKVLEVMRNAAPFSILIAIKSEHVNTVQ